MNNGTLNEDKDYLLARRSRLKWGSVVAHDGRQPTAADGYGEFLLKLGPAWDKDSLSATGGKGTGPGQGSIVP